MKRCAAFIILLLCGSVVTMSVADAQKEPVVRVFRLVSDQYPIEVVSRDTIMNSWLLEQTEDAVRDILQLLDLEQEPFSELTLRWRPGNADGVLSFPRSLILENQQLQLEIDLTGAKRSQVVSIRRTLVIALLQSYIWQGHSSLRQDIIPDPPLWLSEGLLWESLGYAHDAWRGIVDKASRARRVPRLSEIQGWEDLSDLQLERLWQQAFTYCLVRKTFQTRSEKRAVMLWLRRQNYSETETFWDDVSEVESWWQETASEPMQKKIPLKDWGESVATLNQLRHLSVRLSDGSRKMFLIDELPENVELDRRDTSLSEYIQSFDLLALTCHYALSPAVVRYRNALELWLNRDYKRYHEMIDQAKQWEAWSVKQKQNATDMLDWSVVNLGVQSDGSSSELLTDYAEIVRNLEQERLRVRRKFQEDIFKP